MDSRPPYPAQASGQGVRPKQFQAGSGRLPASLSSVLPKSFGKPSDYRSFGNVDAPSRNQQWQPMRGRGRGSINPAAANQENVQNWRSSGHQQERNQENKNQQQKEPFIKKNFPLNFTSLKRLIEETVEPSTIIRKLTDTEAGLEKLLTDHPNKWDLIELVLIVVGDFCAKNGVASFNNDFITVVQILAEHEVAFNNIGL